MKVIAIVISLFKRSLKNKYSLAIYILLPIIGVILPIVIYSNEINDKYFITLLNKDNSIYADYIIDTIAEENKNISIIKEELNLRKSIISGERDLLIEIPKNFGDSLLKSENIEIKFIYMKESKEIFKLKEIINNKIKNIKNIINISNGDEEKFKDIYKKVYIKEKSIVLYDNEKNKDLSVQSLGLAILFIMIITSTSLSSIIQDKNNNVNRRLIYSDISTVTYISAQIIWSFIIFLIQSLIITTVMTIMKITNIEKSSIFFILFLIWIVAISFSIFSIGFCSTEEVLSIINVILVFPSCMLSGCLWAIEIMNNSIQKISLIFPQRRILLLLEQLNNGSNIYILITNTLLILLVSILILVIGIININNNRFKEIL